MRISKPLLLVVVALFGVPASSAGAAFYFSMDYWVNEVPGACTAVNPADLGSYVRQYREPTNQCPGVDVYHSVHGARVHPWSTESFYVKDGYLWQMMEIFQSEQTGQITSYRAFRNQQNFWKGFKIVKTVFNNSFLWWHAPYKEETWTTPSGPACFNTSQTSVDGSGDWEEMSYAGTFYGWFQDKRSTSLNPNNWHDVDVVLRVGRWGGNFFERYYYGQWTNPASGQREGLGLIKWEWRQGTQLIASDSYRYLVDCNVAVECTTCPP